MEAISGLIPKIPQAGAVPSYDEIIRQRVESYNKLQGNLKDVDCPECRNKGYIAKIRNGEEVMAECRCMKMRDTIARIRSSGLEGLLKECTFRNFRTTDGEYQQKMKDAAASFVKSTATGFFVGGQSGSGKTHICTAIVGNFIKQGLSARYFVWREDSVILKAMVNDPSYTKMITEFKTVDVLYIDDLFKQKEIKDADIKLAFEIIDYRLRNKLKTIISTELTEEELIDCDEALAGRIMQMSRGYRLIISRDKRKNFRLKG